MEERNYEYFLGLYIKYIEPVADTFAYCLLRNHFHLLVRVKPEAEVSKTLNKISGVGYPSKRFSDFFNAYAKSINKVQNRTGSLFEHPFGRVPVTKSDQLFNVIRYIHQNPQKHKFVVDFREWKWSSYRTLISEKPTHLNRKLVLDWFGNREEYLQLHADWVADAKTRWFAENDFD